MRADTIAAHGNPHIKTPNLDQLVAAGFSFRGNYIFGGNSGAVCMPSRTMLMSGKTWFHVDTKTLQVARLLPEARWTSSTVSAPPNSTARARSRARPSERKRGMHND